MLETCRRLRRLCRKCSNNVARHDKTPVKSTLLSRDKNILSRDMSFMSRRSDITVVTFRHLEVAIHAYSVCLLLQCCDIRHNFLVLSGIFGGPRATAGHRKYSGILEKFYQWPLFYSQHSRSAFLVSIRVSICYVIKQTLRRIIQ